MTSPVIDGVIAATEMLEHGDSLAKMAPGATIPLALGGGIVSGFIAPDMKSAAIFSALSGAVVPAFTKGGMSGGKLAISMLSSTAIGVVTHHLKGTFLHREEQKKMRADMLEKPIISDTLNI